MKIYSLEDLPERIRSKILVNPLTGCWEWQGTLRNGYGRVKWEGRLQEAHRVVFTLLAEPIRDGLTLDHVKARGCQSDACCWPAHLDPVTQRVNNLRRSNMLSPTCPHGHEKTPENTGTSSDGSHYCRPCKRERSQERRLANLEEVRAYHREYMRSYRKQRAA